MPGGQNSFAGIIVSGPSYSFTFQTDLAIGSGGVALNSGSTFTISAATPSVGIFLTGNSTFSTISSSTLTVNSKIENLGNTFTVFSRAGSTSLPGIITGFGGLTVTATGTVTLAGSNTYSGPTQISSGIVYAGSTTALGVGSAVTVNAGASVLVQNILVSGVGLMGKYYNVAPSSANFSSLAALNAHTAGLTPALTRCRP